MIGVIYIQILYQIFTFYAQIEMSLIYVRLQGISKNIARLEPWCGCWHCILCGELTNRCSLVGPSYQSKRWDQSEDRWKSAWNVRSTNRLIDSSWHGQVSLEQLPPTLDATYECMLSEISGDDRDNALHILYLLKFLKEPLTLVGVADTVVLRPERFDPKGRLI